MSTVSLDAHDDVVARVAAIARDRLAEGQGDRFARFVGLYYERVAADDLVARTPHDLYGAALGHYQSGALREPGRPLVRIMNPDVDEHGWQSPHTIVNIVTDDMPFLVDSVTMVLNREGCGIHLLVHPMLKVQREGGRFVDLIGERAADEPDVAGPMVTEAWMHIEIDRQADADRRQALREALLVVLAQVRSAVDDWRPMHERALAVADELEQAALPVAPVERAEAVGLLRWLADDHFTFLGYRCYGLEILDGDDAIVPVAGSGLGLLRDDNRPLRVHRFADLPPEVRSKARERQAIFVTKANGRSPVHRPDRLEYIGVKRFDADGNVCGEHRFLGLYTAQAYRGRADEVPYLRGKIHAVLERAGLPAESHGGRELWNILETYPRDELFQVHTDRLYEIATGILNLQERKKVRLFARRDDYGRFVSAMVFVPRERYTTAVVEQMVLVLLGAFGGVSAEHTTSISDSVLARVHVLLYLKSDHPQHVDASEVERRLEAVTRTWVDEFRDVLVDAFGEDEGLQLLAAYADDAFPVAYREAYPPRSAVNDVRRLQTLAGEGGFATALHHPVEAPDDEPRLKVYSVGDPISLSSIVPLLEHLGVEVVDERPYEVRPLNGPVVWIYDVGLRCPSGADLRRDATREEFRAAFTALWRGDIERDGFNRLVLAAGLTGRQVTILRAYAKYLRQIGLPFSQAYIEATLVKHPVVARKLVDLFETRFDPALEFHRELESEGIASEIAAALDAVAALDEDRILRAILALVQATVRTNHYRTDADGRPRPFLSVKLDPARVPDLPAPRPKHEIWVYAPRVEGVHLRGGDIARGGLRWSDRREDFRTEILGLVKAQMVKNAVIVPVGAKGGFVVKRQERLRGQDLKDEVIACYRMFVSGLLDLTDNVVDGVVVPPPQTVRRDGDDPYLVVAADKGTATFSDVANDVAISYGFWLGDAFASGGSAGYDHKDMAITAKGAWESVRRHFSLVGLNPDTDPITVVGVGDMSGDVFGNGMLLSHSVRLLAAFDHRHVFIDPTPDAEASWTERRRLFDLPGSSWGDYNLALVSEGGGVWPRSAKSIAVSEAARKALGIDAVTLTPTELISAILRAPVDLLWNGGIGTYVKASTESHADVGDRANDSLRVNGNDLRCRVVGEGGNLGFTQRGRIEYALAGGFVNTDAIDNSAGVDCSDHEVNIKILLDSLVRAGDMTEKQRNTLLAEMTDDISELVLRDNYEQNVALAIARMQAAPMVNVHGRYIRALESEGLIDRDLEFLPTDKVLAERHAAGIGLTTPEFAVLLAYTKTTNVAELLHSDLPDDRYLADRLPNYFPPALRDDRFAAAMRSHRLRREIVATVVVNHMVNRAGTSFDHRMAEETGAGVPDIVRAHLVSSALFELDRWWHEIEQLDGRVAPDVQLTLFRDLRRMIERGVLWLLRHRRPPLDLGATVAAFADGAAAIHARLGSLLAAADATKAERESARLRSAGVPADLADRAGSWRLLHASLDIIEVAQARGRTPEEAAGVYFALGDALDLGWLRDRISALPRDDRWQSQARSAVRDDLQSEHRELLADVLRGGDVFSAPDDLLANWLTANRRGVDRLLAVLADVRSSGVTDLTTLSVALRQLRNLRMASVPAA